MGRGRAGLVIGGIVLSVMMLAIVTGCSSKRVASSSGDQSMTTKGKAATETVRPEQVASVETPPSSAGLPPQQEVRESQAVPSTPGSTSVPSSSPAPAAPGSALVPGSSPQPPASESKTPPTAVEMAGLGDIYFDFDQYTIRRDAQPVLEGNARWLRQQAGKSLLIAGHCDERGTLAYNLVLGEKRAKSAKRYLEDLGIPGSRIQTTSYGEVKPFCKEHNDACWQMNRRAHFVVQ